MKAAANNFNDYHIRNRRRKSVGCLHWGRLLDQIGVISTLFYQHILTDASPDKANQEPTKIMREENLGLAVVISSFKTEDEIAKMVNDTKYGRAAAPFTESIINEARHVAAEIQSVMIWISFPWHYRCRRELQLKFRYRSQTQITLITETHSRPLPKRNRSGTRSLCSFHLFSRESHSWFYQ